MRKLYFCASCDAEPLRVAVEPNLLLYRDEDVLHAARLGLLVNYLAEIWASTRVIV